MGSLAHLVTVRVEEGAEIYYVGMLNQTHDLKFTILFKTKAKRKRSGPSKPKKVRGGMLEKMTNLEPFVLQHLFDRNVVILVGPQAPIDQPRLKDDAKTPVPDDFAVGVTEFKLFPALAVRSDDFNNLLGIVRGCDDVAVEHDGVGMGVREWRRVIWCFCRVARDG